jgi:hypothetical protein
MCHDEEKVLKGQLKNLSRWGKGSEGTA